MMLRPLSELNQMVGWDDGTKGDGPAEAALFLEYQNNNRGINRETSRETSRGTSRVTFRETDLSS